jgi:hypothetical protein
VITPGLRPGPANGPLLLADISGYTSFLAGVMDAHRDDAFADGNIPDAYLMMSALLDGILDRISPPFTLAKLEGDAVFACATDTAAVPHGEALMRCIDACYADFRARLGKAHEIWTCTCGSCARVDTLDLKVVLHVGTFFVHPIAGSMELAGPEVVVAHRLLKNGAAAAVGSGAYVLLTDAAARALGVDTSGAVGLVEEVDGSAVATHVFPLRA